MESVHLLISDLHSWCVMTEGHWAPVNCADCRALPGCPVVCPFIELVHFLCPDCLTFYLIVFITFYCEALFLLNNKLSQGMLVLRRTTLSRIGREILREPGRVETRYHTCVNSLSQGVQTDLA